MFFFLTTTALFDGVSTTQQIVIFLLLLATVRPVGNSMAFLAGLALTYFACGVIGVMNVDKLNALLHAMFPSLSQISDASYYQAQLIMGVIFFAIGPIYYIYKLKSKKPSAESRLISRLKRINPAISFLLGFLNSLTGFPGSVLYIGAIEKISLSHAGRAASVWYLAYYNILYILPMVVPFVIYILLRNHTADIEQKLHIHVNRWNRILTALLFSGMGALFIIDSAFYFITTHPLLKSKFF